MLDRWERDLKHIFHWLKARVQPEGATVSRPFWLFAGRRPALLFSFLLSPVPRNTFLAAVLLALVLLVIRALIAPDDIVPLSGATSSLSSAYMVSIPGPGCVHGADAGLWKRGREHYEHGVDVIDPYTTFACQSNGLLITRTGYYNVFGDAFFYNQHDQPFLTSYIAQVTAQIMHGDSNAAVDFLVHGQSKYGGDGIVVRSNGQWLVAPFDNQTGEEEVPIASGMLAQKPGARAITIEAEVHGAAIVVTLNGWQVATVSDAHYKTTSFISFGVSDVGSSSNPSALFSNFLYRPL
jgi:hypothetical protein